MDVRELEKPAEWFAELESNKNHYKARSERLEAKLAALQEAAREVVKEWDKHKENHPTTMNALRDAIKKAGRRRD
jgi:hypothetical protein